MKKSHSFNELSSKPCKVCGKHIKARLVEQKQNIALCFKCYKASELKRRLGR